MRNDELHNTKSKILQTSYVYDDFRYVCCPGNISLRSKNDMCIDLMNFAISLTISILGHTEFLNCPIYACLHTFLQFRFCIFCQSFVTFIGHTHKSESSWNDFSGFGYNSVEKKSVQTSTAVPTNFSRDHFLSLAYQPDCASPAAISDDV